MRLARIITATAILLMAVEPAVAGSPNPAASLSLAPVRASAPMKRSSKAMGSTAIIAGIAVVGVVIGAVALSHKSSKPASA